MNKCQKCGTEYEGNSCPKCSNQQENFATKPKKKLKAWQIALIVIGVCAVLGGIISAFETTDNAETTANQSVTNEQSNSSVKDLTTKKETTTKAETKEEYIKSCKSVKYTELARNPDKYKGQRIKLEIQVNQIMTGGWFTNGGYRGYEDYEYDWEDSNSTYLKKEWYVSYDLSDKDTKILEDDVVMFYGVFDGTETVNRALTKTKDEVPCLKAQYFEITKEAK